MTRRLALILLLLIPLAGCGEAERPRFIPANGAAQPAPTTDRRPGDEASRPVAIPKNIPMH